MTRVGIVDPTTLLGEAVRERLGGIGVTEESIALVATGEEEAGTLVELGEGAGLVTPFDPERPPPVEVLLVCSPSIEQARDVVEHRREGTELLVLSFDAGEECGPLVFADHPRPETPIARAAPPSALLLLDALSPLAPLGRLEASATVSLPVSVRGGEEDLHRLMGQARALLGFQEVDLGGLPRQLVFNLLPASALGDVISDRDVERAVAAALPGEPRLAVQQLATGLFHAVTASVHVVLDPDPGLDALTAALAASPRLMPASGPPLGALEAAGEPRVVYAPPTASERGYWLWLVADNVLLAAANAVALVEERVRPAS